MTKLFNNSEIWQNKNSKKRFYGTKYPTKIWYVNVDNIFVLKLVKTKINTKYLIGYFDNVRRPLVLVLSKISKYVKTQKARCQFYPSLWFLKNCNFTMGGTPFCDF